MFATDRRVLATERGMVTAETAVVLPLVALFAMVLVWMVTAVTAHVQVVDAARDGARAIARGEDEQAAVAHARRVAPRDSQVRVEAEQQTVTVTVEVDAQAPGWLLVPLPAVHLESQATVAREGSLR